MRPAFVTTDTGKFRQSVRVGPHVLAADAPAADGGTDAGPEPHEWLLAGLGACTSMTLKLYADRKGWPLTAVEVTVQGEQKDGEFLMRRQVTLVGEGLTDEQRARLIDIANKCPVHRTLTGTIRIETSLDDDGPRTFQP
jgi:putative redox protein